MKDRVYTLNDTIGFIELRDWMQEDVALKVVNSARISYSKEKSKVDLADQKLISYLWNHEHTSPFRHTYFTFHLKAPLFVLRQLVKYQVGSTWRTYEVDGYNVSLEVFDLVFDEEKGTSWNEISGRYVQLKPEFYIPTKFRGNTAHGNKQASKELGPEFDHFGEYEKIKNECNEAYKRYEERIEAGVARELARMFLPQNIYSEVYWTISLQSVIHFLRQRLKPDAQFECRKYAEGMYSLLVSDLNKLGISKKDLIDG